MHQMDIEIFLELREILDVLIPVEKWDSGFNLLVL